VGKTQDAQAISIDIISVCTKHSTRKARDNRLRAGPGVREAERKKRAAGIVDRLLADNIDRSDDDIKHGRVTPYEDVLKELGFLRSS
jgi:hypothetical protein